jgi:hypothetical protein
VTSRRRGSCRQAEEERRQNREIRQKELHKWRRLHAQAKAEHQEMQTWGIMPHEHRANRGPHRIMATEKLS